ncbi:MAG: T9SS type A sorting domain-containing protein [Saprospiraceae bacterium]
MREVVTILIVLSFLNLTNGQIANFFADGSRWVYHTYETAEPGQQFVHDSDEQDIIHGDTIISGLTYFKLYKTFHHTLTVFTIPHELTIESYDSIGPSFLRYDLIDKRVYYLPHIDSTERLIYNFNLQVGEMVPMQGDYPMTLVDSIDSISIFGVTAKRFFLAIWPGSPIDQLNYIIEGLGGSNGLTSFQPEFGAVSGEIFMTHLNCFQFMDTIYSPENNDCPFLDFISSEIPVQEDYKVTVSPNPSTDNFTISIDETLLGSTLAIIDGVGRLKQTIILNDLNKNIVPTASGIYFWRLTQKGHFIKTGRVIMQ